MYDPPPKIPLLRWVISLALISIFAVQSFSQSSYNQQDRVIKNSLIIKIKQGVNVENQYLREGMVQTGNQNLDRLFHSLGAMRFQRIFKYPVREDEVRFYEIKFAQDLTSIQDVAEMLRQLDEIEFVEVKHWMRAHNTPNDCLYNSSSACFSSSFGIEQWGLNNDGKVITAYGGPDIPPSRVDADIDADLAWEITTGSDSVIIAFIDTGMDWTHPEFTNNLWVNPNEDKNGDGIFQYPSDLGEIVVDGYPGVRTVDDDNDGHIDYHDYQIKWADYNCNNTSLCGPDGRLFTADDDSTDKILASDDDDENGLRDDIIGWDWTACKSGYWDPDPYSQGGGSSHGNLVASIAVAEGNNNQYGELDKAMAGVTWKSRIMTLKVSEDQNNIDPTLVGYAIDYARVHGAKIINLSLGTYTDESSIRYPIEDALSAGCFIVASAGNDTTNINQMYPASYPGVCGVIGSDRRDIKLDLSNYNPSNEQWYDLSAPGDSIIALLPLHDVIDPKVMDYYYSVERGTSGAAPFVSGTAVLLKSQYPIWTNTDILWQIKNMTDNIDPYQSTYYVGKLGTGRLNAARALGYGGTWESVYISANHAWEQRAFVADTMVVDSAAVLTLRDSLVVNCADADNKAGIKLQHGSHLVVPPYANVTIDDSFYVEIGKDCIFEVGRYANVSFGKKCVVSVKDSGLFQIDSSATVTFAPECSVLTASEGWMKVQKNALVKCGDSTIIISAGYMQVEGELDKNATFTKRTENEKWKGIHFPLRVSPPNFMSTFNYATIEYATVGIESYGDSLSITHSQIHANDVGIRTVSCSPIINNNYFPWDVYAALQLSGQDRTIEFNRIIFASSFGIILTSCSNDWIGNISDSSATGLQLYSSTTSQFHSNDEYTGNTFRYNNDKGIMGEDSSPALIGAGGTEGYNSVHDNGTWDIDILDYTYLTGNGNYVLNGCNIQADASCTVDWTNEIFNDLNPTDPPKIPTITTKDTLKLAVSERLNGNYTSAFDILKNIIDKNHGGQYTPIALRLLLNILNDAEFIRKNDDPISKDIKTARTNFEVYLNGLMSNSYSIALKKAAAKLLADHKMVIKEFSAADSLYELLVNTYPNSEIEKRSLYGQVIARKSMNEISGAIVKTDALRTKYPDDYIGVIAKIFMDLPLTTEEKAMIQKGNPSPIRTSVKDLEKNSFELYQNYPNPFNPLTQISFSIPGKSTVVINIYDALGRKIKVYGPAEYVAGVHRVLFDASQYSSGVYLYEMNATSSVSSGSFNSMKKMILMK